MWEVASVPGLYFFVFKLQKNWKKLLLTSRKPKIQTRPSLFYVFFSAQPSTHNTKWKLHLQIPSTGNMLLYVNCMSIFLWFVLVFRLKNIHPQVIIIACWVDVMWCVGFIICHFQLIGVITCKVLLFSRHTNTHIIMINWGKKMISTPFMATDMMLTRCKVHAAAQLDSL